MPEGRAAAQASLRSLWTLSPGLTFLNHGSFGLTPKPVLRAQARLKREMVIRKFTKASKLRA